MSDGELMCRFKRGDRVRWGKQVWEGNNQYSAEHRGVVLNNSEYTGTRELAHVQWNHEPASWNVVVEHLELVEPQRPAVERPTAWERIMGDE